MSMNVAHDLDSVENDPIVVKGRYRTISSKISTGSVESITQTLTRQWQS